MFPANVYAALEGITTGPVDGLIPRTLIQLVFLAATIAVLVRSGGRFPRLSRPHPSRMTSSVEPSLAARD
jgi:hypothetical protein